MLNDGTQDKPVRIDHRSNYTQAYLFWRYTEITFLKFSNFWVFCSESSEDYC